MERFFDRTVPDASPGLVQPGEVYRRLDFPRGADWPGPRPYTVINMVATADGKAVVGGPGSTRAIGSRTDHLLLRQVLASVDALLIGAGATRQDDPGYPRFGEERRRQRQAQGLRPDPLWALVSARGEFVSLPRGFQAGREHTALLTTALIDPARRAELEPHTRVFVCGDERVDPLELGRVLREELGVSSLNCLGGPTLNASLLEAGVVDELFLTVAPWLRGGFRLPTIVEGSGAAAERLAELELMSLYGEGGELYLRYRVSPRR